MKQTASVLFTVLIVVGLISTAVLWIISSVSVAPNVLLDDATGYPAAFQVTEEIAKEYNVEIPDHIWITYNDPGFEVLALAWNNNKLKCNNIIARNAFRSMDQARRVKKLFIRQSSI
jgi:hypothetical protein